jgi:hypothetical protein
MTFQLLLKARVPVVWPDNKLKKDTIVKAFTSSC